MKIALKIIAALTLIVIIAFVTFGFLSQNGNANGLVDGKLSRCPDTPNCISSEFEGDKDHYLSPIRIVSDNSMEAMTRMKSIVEDMGGRIQKQSDDYLAASFTSSLFRFVDDLEIRIDKDNSLIHLRSASRVGYSDRGVNKQRLELLKSKFSSAS